MRGKPQNLLSEAGLPAEDVRAEVLVEVSSELSPMFFSTAWAWRLRREGNLCGSLAWNSRLS